MPVYAEFQAECFSQCRGLRGSQEYPLNVTLDIGEEGTASAVAKTGLLKGLLKSAYRWESVNATCRHLWMDEFSKLFPQHLPILQTLRLSTDSQRYFFQANSAYISLQTLKLSGMIIDPAKWPELPALETLSVASSKKSLYKLLPLSSKSLRLHTLCMVNMYATNARRHITGHKLRSIHLPSLQHLHLTQFTRRCGVESVLSSIRSPLLGTLVVGELKVKDVNPPKWQIHPVEFPFLESVSVHDAQCFSNVVQELLPHLPSTKHLFFDASPLEGHLGTLPAPLQTDPQLCPLLKSLTTRHVALSAIRQLVQARPGKIEEVNIAFEDVASWYLHDTFQGLRAYEKREKDLLWLCSKVPRVRLYGVKHGHVQVRIDDVNEKVMRKKAKVLEPICDFEWIPCL